MQVELIHFVMIQLKEWNYLSNARSAMRIYRTWQFTELTPHWHSAQPSVAGGGLTGLLWLPQL